MTRDALHSTKSSDSDASDASDASETSFQRIGMYVALAAAWVAASGSLYMSEVLEWEPCHWCWYQRILMYPLALVLALGLIKKDKNVPHYALLLAVPGACASVYHILLQKVPYFKVMETCAATNPCSGDYLIRLGIPFVTIPMLALTVFVIVIAMSLLALPKREIKPVITARDEDEFVAKPLLSPALLVALIVIPVVALFAISGFITNSRKPAKGTILTEPIAANAPDAGQQLYNQGCASCHGPNANALVRKTFLQKSNFELLAFVKQGRTTLESEISGGQAMPAMGGPNNVGLTDEQVLKIVQFMRQANK